jgi:hypothetical protein
MSSTWSAENKRLLCYKNENACDEIAAGPWPAIWDPAEFSVYGQTIVVELADSDRATASVNGWPVPGPMLAVEPGDLVRIRRFSSAHGDCEETLLCIGRAITGKRLKVERDHPHVDTFTGLPIDQTTEAIGCVRCGSVYAPTTASHLDGRCASCGDNLVFADMEDQPDCYEDGWL